jgi:hypothetical protein
MTERISRLSKGPGVAERQSIATGQPHRSAGPVHVELRSDQGRGGWRSAGYPEHDQLVLPVTRRLQFPLAFSGLILLF